MILDGILGHIKAGSPFLMYPRFVQLFLDKQLEGVPKPQDFVPTVVLPPKVFTFMSNKGVKFSGHNTPLSAHILEVAQAVRDAADASSDSANSEHSASEHTSTPPMHHLSKLLQVKELPLGHYQFMFQGRRLIPEKVLLHILFPRKVLLCKVLLQSKM